MRSMARCAQRARRVMTKVCCSTFRSVSNGWPDLPGDLDPQEDEIALAHVLIRWRPHIGFFCLQHMAISHCPWCGSQLPDKHGLARAKARERGVFIDIGAKGAVQISGRLADEDLAKLLTTLRPTKTPG